MSIYCQRTDIFLKNQKAMTLNSEGSVILWKSNILKIFTWSALLSERQFQTSCVHVTDRVTVLCAILHKVSEMQQTTLCDCAVLQVNTKRILRCRRSQVHECQTNEHILYVVLRVMNKLGKEQSWLIIQHEVVVTKQRPVLFYLEY